MAEEQEAPKKHWRPRFWVGLALGIVVGFQLAAVAVMGAAPSGETPGTPVAAAAPDTERAGAVPSEITLAKYAALQSGMSRAAAMEVLGVQCDETSSTDIAGMNSSSYSCMNPDGSNVMLIFQDGRLVSKAQFGLR